MHKATSAQRNNKKRVIVIGLIYKYRSENEGEKKGSNRHFTDCAIIHTIILTEKCNNWIWMRYAHSNNETTLLMNNSMPSNKQPPIYHNTDCIQKMAKK